MEHPLISRLSQESGGEKKLKKSAFNFCNNVSFLYLYMDCNPGNAETLIIVGI